MQCFLPWDALCSLLLQPPATAVYLWVFLHSVLSSGIEMHNILCWDQVTDLIPEKSGVLDLVRWCKLVFLNRGNNSAIMNFFCPLWSSRPSLTEVPVHVFFLKMTQTVDLVTPKGLFICFIWVFQPNVSLPFMYWHLIGPYIYTERISKNQV